MREAGITTYPRIFGDKSTFPEKRETASYATYEAVFFFAYCLLILPTPIFYRYLYYGHLDLFIPRFNCFVERCSKSSCTLCTLRFLRSVRLALESLMTINRGALMCCVPCAFWGRCVILSGRVWEFSRLIDYRANKPSSYQATRLHC